MIVFISQRQSHNVHGSLEDLLEKNYVDFFSSFQFAVGKAVIVPVANHPENVEKLIGRVKPDLIVLSGGNNIDPISIGKDDRVNDLAHLRDATEKMLIMSAQANQIPILGICRGCQFINVHFGGKITFHLDNHPAGRSHDCIMAQQRYHINSFHDHGIRRQDLSSQLKPLVTTMDGNLIEAYASVPSCKSTILGLQWHPEREQGNTSLFRKLFTRVIGL